MIQISNRSFVYVAILQSLQEIKGCTVIQVVFSDWSTMATQYHGNTQTHLAKHVEHLLQEGPRLLSQFLQPCGQSGQRTGCSHQIT